MAKPKASSPVTELESTYPVVEPQSTSHVTKLESISPAIKPKDNSGVAQPKSASSVAKLESSTSVTKVSKVNGTVIASGGKQSTQKKVSTRINIDKNANMSMSSTVSSADNLVGNNTSRETTSGSTQSTLENLPTSGTSMLKNDMNSTIHHQAILNSTVNPSKTTPLLTSTLSSVHTTSYSTKPAKVPKEKTTAMPVATKTVMKEKTDPITVKRSTNTVKAEKAVAASTAVATDDGQLSLYMALALALTSMLVR